MQKQGMTKQVGPLILSRRTNHHLYRFPKTDMVTRHDLGDLMMSRPINRVIRRPN
jgi:hypothetical protein